MNRIGDWMQTFTGRQFWPLDPRPEEIFIEDIAHALSLQCRYAGHVRQFYSVAEHSVRVSRDCKLNPLWGLLHDAAEAYLVDLPRPVKHASGMGSEYQQIERQLMRSVCMRFELLLTEPVEVRVADDFLLQWEGRDLMAPHPVPWRGEGLFPLPNEVIEPMDARAAESAFLLRFYDLTDRISPHEFAE